MSRKIANYKYGDTVTLRKDMFVSKYANPSMTHFRGQTVTIYRQAWLHGYYFINEDDRHNAWHVRLFEKPKKKKVCR